MCLNQKLVKISFANSILNFKIETYVEKTNVDLKLGIYVYSSLVIYIHNYCYVHHRHF